MTTPVLTGEGVASVPDFPVNFPVLPFLPVTVGRIQSQQIKFRVGLHRCFTQIYFDYYNDLLT